MYVLVQANITVEAEMLEANIHKMVMWFCNRRTITVHRPQRAAQTNSERYQLLPHIAWRMPRSMSCRNVPFCLLLVRGVWSDHAAMKTQIFTAYTAKQIVVRQDRFCLAVAKRWQVGTSPCGRLPELTILEAQSTPHGPRLWLAFALWCTRPPAWVPCGREHER